MNDSNLQITLSIGEWAYSLVIFPLAWRVGCDVTYNPVYVSACHIEPFQVSRARRFPPTWIK